MLALSWLGRGQPACRGPDSGALIAAYQWAGEVQTGTVGLEYEE